MTYLHLYQLFIHIAWAASQRQELWCELESVAGHPVWYSYVQCLSFPLSQRRPPPKLPTKRPSRGWKIPHGSWRPYTGVQGPHGSERARAGKWAHEGEVTHRDKGAHMVVEGPIQVYKGPTEVKGLMQVNGLMKVKWPTEIKGPTEVNSKQVAVKNELILSHFQHDDTTVECSTLVLLQIQLAIWCF